VSDYDSRITVHVLFAGSLRYFAWSSSESTWSAQGMSAGHVSVYCRRGSERTGAATFGEHAVGD
jgi:hypothetical protein